LSLGRRVVANTLARWTAIGVGSVAGFVLTPYLLQHLGAERFGIYQICRQLILYLGLFNFGIGSISRFATQAIAVDDRRRLNELLSSALVLFAGVASIGFLACALVALRAPAFFGVDPAHASEMRWLFIGLGGWWTLTMLGFPARGIFIGHQRYGLLSLTTGGGWILTVLAVVGLFETGHVGLGAVGLAFFIGACCQFLSFHGLARRIQPSLRWSWRLVDRASLRTLYGFGLWNMLFVVAGLFIWSSDSIVIGRMLGPEAVPFYAIPFMLIHYGRIVGQGFAAQMTPVAATHLAKNDMAALQTTLLHSTRIGLVLTLAGNGILVLVVDDLLRLWIGPDFAPSWTIYACLMLSFWAVYAGLSIHEILIGAGDIRLPATVALLAGLATLVLKILALGWLGLGLEAVALLNCVFILPMTLVYMPWCACRLTGMPLLRLYREAYAGPILAFIPVAGLGWLVTEHLSPLDLVEFCISLIALTGVYLLAAFWTLTSAERAAVTGALRAPWLRPGKAKTAGAAIDPGRSR
jgi:O-antigen/teichoic acid export membrane protein